MTALEFSFMNVGMGKHAWDLPLQSYSRLAEVRKRLHKTSLVAQSDRKAASQHPTISVHACDTLHQTCYPASAARHLCAAQSYQELSVLQSLDSHWS